MLKCCEAVRGSVAAFLRDVQSFCLYEAVTLEPSSLATFDPTVSIRFRNTVLTVISLVYFPNSNIKRNIMCIYMGQRKLT